MRAGRRAPAEPSGSVTGCACLRRSACVPGRAPSLFSGEPDGLAPNGVVLAERVTLPVVVHQDPAGVRMALEADAEQIPCLTLVPVGRGPDRDEARHRLAVVD